MIRRLGFSRVVEVAYGADLVAARTASSSRRTRTPTLHRHHLPGHRALRREVPSGTGAVPRAGRVADDRHGPRACTSSTARTLGSSSSAPASPRRPRPRPSATGETSTPRSRSWNCARCSKNAGITAESVEPARVRPAAPGQGDALPGQARHPAGRRHQRKTSSAGDVVAADGGDGVRPRPARVRATGTSTSGCSKCCPARAAASWARARAPTRRCSRRRAAVSRYVREHRLPGPRHRRWPEAPSVDLIGLVLPRRPDACRYRRRTKSAPSSSEWASRRRPTNSTAARAATSTCREHAIAIFDGLAESEMCLPTTITRLNQAIGELGDHKPATRQRAAGAGAVGEAREHGPARRRHRPRGQQPAGRGAAVQPAAA